MWSNRRNRKDRDSGYYRPPRPCDRRRWRGKLPHSGTAGPAIQPDQGWCDNCTWTFGNWRNQQKCGESFSKGKSVKRRGNFRLCDLRSLWLSEYDRDRKCQQGHHVYRWDPWSEACNLRSPCAEYHDRGTDPSGQWCPHRRNAERKTWIYLPSYGRRQESIETGIWGIRAHLDPAENISADSRGTQREPLRGCV